jgi:hypothetical protein
MHSLIGGHLAPLRARSCRSFPGAALALNAPHSTCPPSKPPASCNVDLKVTDSGTPRQDFTASSILTVSATGPSSSAGGPYTLLAGETLTLNASTSRCSLEVCTWDWTVSCPGRAPVYKTGVIAAVTSGPSNTPDAFYDLDTLGIVSKLTCTVSLVGTGEADAGCWARPCSRSSSWGWWLSFGLRT